MLSRSRTGLAEGFTLLIIDKRCGILDPFMLTSDALLCRTGQGGVCSYGSAHRGSLKAMLIILSVRGLKGFS